MNLDAFEALAQSRRSVRHFKSDPLPAGLLERLLNCARWAPSGYNLQPVHFAVATDAALKQRLLPPCMNQKQIATAPAVVIFCADRRVIEHNFERVLAADRQAGAINADYERLLRKVTKLAFGHGPAGLGWLWKATLPPLLRLGMPVPSIPAVHKEYWLVKQAMLSAMNFMLAAQAAGLASVPMEGFDAGRVRKTFGIPSSFIVALVVPVGYAADQSARKTRLPLESMLHMNQW